MKRSILAAAILFIISGFTLSINAQSDEGLTVQNQHQIKAQYKTNWVDENGDGICDNFGTGLSKGMKSGKKGFGPGDGTGNQGIGPKDGTGYGKMGGNGTGICDGTGPKGNGNKGGRR